MAIIQNHWAKLTDEQWQHLAEQYLLEIRENGGKEYEEGNHKWGQIVVSLNFWSPPGLLWKFILLTVSLAESDGQLGSIAAGEIEHLLGRAGDEFIDLVEQEAKSNSKFARTLTGCCQFQMTDEVWARVQKLQAQVEDKLL
ncbi:MAG TPA: hypothetical protein VNB22_24375 [Pyrinomonadaceae bacterium]|nr:hypothetical protein [Pyrinomonadaceae bacterium]